MSLAKVPLDAFALVFGTLFAFCVMQSAFWWLVGSVQFERVVQKKADALNMYFEHAKTPFLRAHFCTILSRYSTTDNNQKLRKNEQNWKLMRNAFLPFALSNLVLFLLCAYLYVTAGPHTLPMHNRTSISNAQLKGFYIAICLVVFSFTTEVIIFMFVIDPYVLIGDLEILAKLLNSTREST